MRVRPSWDLALAATAVAALLVLALRPGPDRGIEIERRDPPPGLDEIRVEVAGAVASPGVVAVAPGERVADAIARAGGLSPEADTAPLNLSRRLLDEDRVLVPARGERAALLDLNRADTQQLEALPGIGPVYARAVVASREERGPFSTTDQLVERGVLPARVYAAIRDLVAVR